MLKLILIAIGGAFGALSRYTIAFLATKFFPGNFPLGTLIVNILGSFLVCFLAKHFLYSAIDPMYRYLFIVGFLGALTTFSSFTYESLVLFQEKMILLGILNISLNFVLSFIGGILGFALANYLFLK